MKNTNVTDSFFFLFFFWNHDAILLLSMFHLSSIQDITHCLPVTRIWMLMLWPQMPVKNQVFKVYLYSENFDLRRQWINTPCKVQPISSPTLQTADYPGKSTWRQSFGSSVLPFGLGGQPFLRWMMSVALINPPLTWVSWLGHSLEVLSIPWLKSNSEQPNC